MGGDLHGDGPGELDSLHLGAEVELFEAIGLDVDVANDDPAHHLALRLKLVASRGLMA